MSGESHAEIVRDAYAAIGLAHKSGDSRAEATAVDALFALYSTGAQVHHGGHGPFAGTHDGLTDIQATMGRAFALSDGTFREFEPHICVGDNQFVYTASRASARRPDGRHLDTIVGAVFRFDGGKIVEVFQHVADQPGWDEFWS